MVRLWEQAGEDPCHHAHDAEDGAGDGPVVRTLQGTPPSSWVTLTGMTETEGGVLTRAVDGGGGVILLER